MHKHIKKDCGSREPYLENKSIKKQTEVFTATHFHTFISHYAINQFETNV